ncbi:MAG: hypothetical protein ACFFBP_19380 [Promethearchaeota archaeon]
MLDLMIDLINTKRLDKPLKKYKGGYFGILGGILLIYMLSVGTMLYHFTEAPVTIGSIWISSIGAARNGSQIIFMMGMFSTLLCSIPLIIDLIRKMLPGNKKQKNWLLLPLTNGLFALLGGFFLTVFNMADYPLYHAISATIFFINVGLMIGNFSFIMLLNKDIPKFQPFIGLSAGLVFIIFLVQGIPLLISSNFDFVFMITDTSPTTYNFRIWEWIAVIALLIWFIETGIFLLVKFR